ncbi:type VI secretion system membrane subunit TssM [Tatumella saanichensis]|uniref:type VI secretion system membrane subunit TssM n=1 Tax=Tatumella saanichensis TaxID=480813 RepID=UPI0004A32218|nr:type VI secretion system membrane subunit TssM [Tatumella saanichensis]
MMLFIRRIFSRQNLKVLQWILLGIAVMALVWFTGPYIGFGDARPLADRSARLIAGVLILFLLLAMIAHWSWAVRILAIIAAVIWIPGPYFYLAGRYWLAGVTPRLTLIGLLAGGYLAGSLLRRWRQHKATEATTPRQPRNGAAPSGIDAMFRQVTDSIRQRPRGLARLWHFADWRRRDANLPWFIVIGSRGTGKTSAIVHSGQYFPQAEADEPQEIQAGEPQNCRCWLANDAVYLDTAGKYISDPQDSEHEWQEILSSLNKYRPSRAINGALVMLSATELLSQEGESLNHLAAVFRRRLSEMRRITGVYFPVYIVVTQMDTLNGFAEYFRGLTSQERQDIWGISFSVGSGTSVTGQKVAQLIPQLVQRIEADINARLLSEYDLNDRRRMYGFPGDLSLLVHNLQHFLQILFFSSRFDDTHDNSALRGVYLTSCYPHASREFVNTQTVIRQWTEFLRTRTENSDELPEISTASAGNEKFVSQPCFLRQLFCELIIRDQALAKDLKLNITGPAMQRWVKNIAVMLLLVGISWGMFISYGKNNAYLQEITEKITQLRADKESIISDLSDDRSDQLARLSSLLTRLQALPEYAGLNLQDPGLSWRYGLYTGADVSATASQLYHSMLQKLLLPVIEAYATQRLQRALNLSRDEDLYLNLRLYTMVYGLNPADITFLEQQLAGLWQSTTLLPAGTQNNEVNRHLKALFLEPIEGGGRQQADDNLVRKARESLESQSRSARIYSRLKERLAAEAPQDLDLYQLTEGSSGDLFELREGATLTALPGLFTRQGFPLFKKKVMTQLKSLTEEDQWVLAGRVNQEGNTVQQAADATQQLVRLYNDILNRYLDEYASLWQRYLAGIQIKTYARTGKSSEGSQQRDLYRLGRLVAPDSPMRTLLTRLVAETTLTAEDTESPNSGSSLVSGRAATAVVRAAQQLTASEKIRVRMRVDDHFSALRLFVTGQRDGSLPTNGNAGNSSPLGQLLSQLGELQVVLSQSLTGSDSATNQIKADLSSAIRTRAMTWPVPVKEITLPLLNQIVSGARTEAVTRTAGEIALGPAEFCRKAFAGRYPFAVSSQDASINDFERFFAPGGDADRYFTEQLAAKTEITAKRWYFKGTQPGDAENRKLQMFRVARQISEAFFPAGSGQRLSLPVKISVPWMSGSARRMQLRIGKQLLSYSHGPVRPVTLAWPTQGEEPAVSLSFTSAKTGDTETQQFGGDWGLFRWLESMKMTELTGKRDVSVAAVSGDNQATLQISGLAENGQLVLNLLRSFKCA